MVSLLEALKSAKHEIDSQGDRVKYLETALACERRARENAERRAQSLAGGRFLENDHERNGVVEEEAFEPPLDSVELMEQELPNGTKSGHGEDDKDLLSRSASMATIKNADMHPGPKDIDASTSRLQARLDLMVKEMDEMKQVMESYKQRAEDAEEGRKSLAEMVENLRAGRSANSVLPAVNDDDTTLLATDVPAGDFVTKHASYPADRDRSNTVLPHKPHLNGHAVPGDMHRELEKTVSNVLQQHQQRHWGTDGGGRMVQSAPYVSMVGVVLIGVGIMTWLNGWQPGGEK